MSSATNKKTESALRQLAIDIVNGHRVLFITGAGLSVASGISTYRSEKNSIWNKFVMSWGTRKKFLEDPLEWWNKFWLRTHEKPEFLNAKPNAGHIAIAHIAQRCKAKIITQNIDSLHPFTLNIRNERLVEVHGRLGLYKCIANNCKYAWDESITDLDLSKYAVEGTSMDEGNLMLKKVPCCPSCNKPIMPQSLLFDEKYESHSFYQWTKALNWMEEADIFVFVGTSFSVGVTSEAIDAAVENNKIVYNFNLTEEKINPNTYSVVGKSEETLPRLYNYMCIAAGKPRMYFYPVYSDEEEEEVEDDKYVIPPSMLPLDRKSKRQKTYY